MSIEVLEDLNLQACCCDLTLCPVPTIDYESISATRVGWTVPVIDPLDPEYPLKYYLVATETEVNTDVPAVPGETTANYYGTTYTGTISYAFTWSRSFNTSPSGAGCVPAAVVTCSGGGAVTQTDTQYTYDSWPLEPPLSGGSGVWNSYVIYTVVRTVTMPTPCVFHTVDVTHQYTLTYEDPHPPYGPASYTVELDDGYPVTTSSDWDRSGYADSLYPVAFPESALSGQVTRATWIGLLAAVSFSVPATCKWNDSAAVSSTATATVVRARFRIPHTWADQVTGSTVPFTGTFFKITYDIIEEPTGWNYTSPTVFRSFHVEDAVVLWEPVGAPPTDPDDPYWFTPWITIAPPTVRGSRRIVNIRFVCRDNWFIGEVPQVTGEAVTLPDP